FSLAWLLTRSGSLLGFPTVAEAFQSRTLVIDAALCVPSAHSPKPVQVRSSTASGRGRLRRQQWRTGCLLAGSRPRGKTSRRGRTPRPTCCPPRISGLSFCNRTCTFDRSYRDTVHTARFQGRLRRSPLSTVPAARGRLAKGLSNPAGA